MFSGGGDDGSERGKILGAEGRSEATGYLLLDLHHTNIALGLIVGEGHQEVPSETQNVGFKIAKTHEQIMAGTARLPAASPLLQERRLGPVEGQAGNDDGVILISP